MLATISRRGGRRAAAAVAVAVAAVAGLAVFFQGRAPETRADSSPQPGKGAKAAAVPPAEANVVTLDSGQRESIGLRVEPAVAGSDNAVIRAYGQIGPDETKYAYITPRASGVVRYVTAHEGQEVRTGDLLAMIDSPDLAQARFDLYTQTQELEIASAQAEWQGVVYKNTVALLASLEAGDSPERIDQLFEDRPVGANRESLISAYSARRLAKVTFDRNLELSNQKIIPAKQFQQVRAEYESAEAAYQSLTEQLRYSARLADTQAKQNLRKAETGVRVAKARLRMFGVSPDGTVATVKDGKVVGVLPDGTLTVPDRPPAGGRPDVLTEPLEGSAPVKPVGGHSQVGPISGAAAHEESADDRPVGSYPIWAPFDGTVIDRMMIVPGVFVDTTHRIFTLADLSTVWVESHVHESNYGAITRGGSAKVRFTSPAYPGETFEADLLYSGDLVDPKTRTLRLMARAQNPDRKLKPGMFVDVEVLIPEGKEVVLAPASAVLTEGKRSLLFVEVRPNRFERREVTTASTYGDKIEVLSGLKAGESVVTEGGFKLKSELALRRDNGSGPAGASE